jgi:hypothetical protein
MSAPAPAAAANSRPLSEKAQAAASSLLGNQYVHMGLIGVGIALLIASIVTMTKFAGDKDNWTSLKPQLSVILPTSLVGGLALLAGAGLYFVTRPEFSVTYAIVLASIAVTLAVAAINIAVITR